MHLHIHRKASDGEKNSFQTLNSQLWYCDSHTAHELILEMVIFEFSLTNLAHAQIQIIFF